MPADTDIALNVQTRPSVPEDAPFLHALFVANCTHLAALGLPPVALAAMLDQQYAFRQTDYSRRFPQARTLIALVDEVPVGQVMVDDDGTTLHNCGHCSRAAGARSRLRKSLGAGGSDPGLHSPSPGGHAVCRPHEPRGTAPVPGAGV